MRETRVTMVVKLYPPWIGGLEAHVADLAVALQRLDPSVRVSVVTGQERMAAQRREIRDGVTVHRATTLARVARTPITAGLRTAIRATRPDILHFHMPYPWGEMRAALDPGVRVFATHYHDVVRQRLLGVAYAPVRTRVLARAERIVAWSQALVEHSPVLRAHRDKVVVSPGGIETQRFLTTPALRERGRTLRARLTAASGDRGVLLFVGRLVYYKGVSQLLHAMRQVDAHLLVVGEGTDRAGLEVLARALGITSRVTFVGGVRADDLPSWYHAADCLVLPSTEPTETFGLVQLEAHASGIPAICTALPTGVASANQHGVTGLVVPPGDVDALASATRRLLGDPEERRRMGAAAQARVVRDFDISRCASDMLALYHASRVTRPSTGARGFA